MRRTMLRGVLPLVAVLCAAQAQAQVTLGAGGGPSSPVGSLGDVVNAGWHAGFVADIGVPLLPFSVRGDLVFQNLPGAAGGDSYRQVWASVNGRLSLLPVPVVSPYVTGGLGLYGSSFDPDPQGSGSWSADPGLNIGVGARINLLVIRPFVEARYHRVLTDPARAFIPVTVGVLF